MSFLYIVYNRVPCNMSSLVISFFLLAGMCVCVCVWIHVCICIQRPEVNIGCYLCLPYFLRQLLNLELTWLAGRSSCLHSPVHAAIPGFVWGCRDGAKFSWCAAHISVSEPSPQPIIIIVRCIHIVAYVLVPHSFSFFYSIIGILFHYLNFIPLLRYKFWLFTCHLMDI